jgi:hypothetical protein
MDLIFVFNCLMAASWFCHFHFIAISREFSLFCP